MANFIFPRRVSLRRFSRFNMKDVKPRLKWDYTFYLGFVPSKDSFAYLDSSSDKDRDGASSSKDGYAHRTYL